MAVTQDQINALNEQIASAERQVTLGAQSVTYRSIDDLIKARDALQRELNTQTDAAAGKVRPKRRMAYYSGRGYNDGIN